jgi:hypothetical protein
MRGVEFLLPAETQKRFVERDAPSQKNFGDSAGERVVTAMEAKHVRTDRRRTLLLDSTAFNLFPQLARIVAFQLRPGFREPNQIQFILLALAQPPPRIVIRP